MKEKKATENRLFERKMLRLLETNRGFEKLSSDQEETIHAGIPGNNHYNYRKEIETAWLKAERKKANALMEWQKRRFIC